MDFPIKNGDFPLLFNNLQALPVWSAIEVRTTQLQVPTRNDACEGCGCPASEGFTKGMFRRHWLNFHAVLERSEMVDVETTQVRKLQNVLPMIKDDQRCAKCRPNVEEKHVFSAANMVFQITWVYHKPLPYACTTAPSFTASAMMLAHGMISHSL